MIHIEEMVRNRIPLSIQYVRQRAKRDIGYHFQIWSHASIQSLPREITFSGSTISTPCRPLNVAAVSTVLSSTVIVVGLFGTYGFTFTGEISARFAPSS